ncbi:23S rRNA (uracil(1939)-C(5))-methyltransferase RlmD [Pelagibaculum spongiae]|uniref:23S rRNA (Uracil(1939)-C(5))-methyltransferase RlmD n=2 Tax=Pelagibaculum spongiae TaxID=2080658 RepID=A0A2V1GPH5_9GAMM|nr:23S rRNA (uracil(1939)-C(5))-methyltransferase RlmD [Pelagibaculum spongiae]
MVTGGRKQPPLRQNNQKLTLKVDRLSHDGRGVAHNDGKIVFISGALAGEMVECRIEKQLSKQDHASLLKVIEASPQRIEPFCKYFDKCGGCSMQMLQLEQQISHKQQILAEQLAHFAECEVQSWQPPLFSNIENTGEQGYRYRARLHVNYTKGLVQVGFLHASSHKIVELNDGCPVLVKQLRAILPLLQPLLAEIASGFRADEIQLTYSEQKISLGLVGVKRQKKPAKKVISHLQQWAEMHQVSVYYQLPDNPIEMVYGDEFLIYQIMPDLKLKFSPSDFTQVNPQMNRAMINQALQWIDIQPAKQYLDLFCGLGNFTLAMAKSGANVTGFEVGQDMVLRAMDNAKLNGLENVNFIKADLFKSIDPKWQKQRFEAILLDPPRAGAETVCRWLANQKLTHKILYVSCNPSTLARDAGILCQGGFSVSRAGVMDMFPHTSHVESMILFER